LKPETIHNASEQLAEDHSICFSSIILNLTVLLGSLISGSLFVKSEGMQRVPLKTFCLMAAHIRKAVKNK